MRQASRSLSTFNRQLKGMKGLVGGLGVFFGARSLTRGFRAAFEEARGFEREMTRIITLVGISEKQVAAWTGQVKNMAQAVGVGPQELARALFVVTSAGERGAGAMQVLEQAAKASASGLGETATIARVVTAAMQAYASTNLKAAEATDILVATVRAGNLEAAELAASLGKVLPIASSVGASFTDINAFIATFSLLGISAADAVTSLKGVLQAFIKPSADAAEALADIGISAEVLRRQIREDGLTATLIGLSEALDGNVGKLVKVIPRVEALAGFLGTASVQGEKFVSITNAITRSQGLNEEAFRRTTETADFAFRQLGATGRLLIGMIGEELLPLFVSVNRRVQASTTELNKWATGIAATFAIVVAIPRTIVNSFAIVTDLLRKTLAEIGFSIQGMVNTAIIVPISALFRLLRIPVQLATVPLSGFQRQSLAAADRIVKDATDIRDAWEDVGRTLANFVLALEGVGVPSVEIPITLDPPSPADIQRLVIEPFVAIPKTLREAGEDAGRNFIRGLINGMQSLGDLLIGAVKFIAEFLIIREFNKSLGNQSPSKFAALAGRNTVLGYIKGLKDAATAIPSAVGGAFALAGGPAGAAAGGGTIVNQEMHFHFHAPEQRGMRQLLMEQQGTIAEIVGKAAQDGVGFRRMLRGR